MTEYFQRLLNRMNQPSHAGPRAAPPLVPFISTMTADDTVHDPFEPTEDRSADAMVEDSLRLGVREMANPVGPSIAQSPPLAERQPGDTASPDRPFRAVPGAPVPLHSSASAPQKTESPGAVQRPVGESASADRHSTPEPPAQSPSRETIVVTEETLVTAGPPEVGTPLPDSDTSPPNTSEEVAEAAAPKTVTRPAEQTPSDDLSNILAALAQRNELTPPTGEPAEAQSLQPSVPQPPPLSPPQPEEPRLVIGRLSVEVVPSPPVSVGTAQSQARPAPRARPRSQRSQPVRSKLRFGLGQL